MKQRDIEVNKLTYQDIAYNIIKEDNEPKTTLELFKEICLLLQLDEQKYQEVIGDFYTALNLDKRFHLLDNKKWDLKEKHPVGTILDEDDLDDLEGIDLIDDYDIDEDDEEETETEEDKETEEEIIDEDDEILDEEEISEIEDLTIIDEEEIESDDII